MIALHPSLLHAVRLRAMVTVLTLGLLSLPALQAQVISLNFYAPETTGGTTYDLGPTDQAGAGTAFSDNWNNYLNDSVGNPSGSDLMDNSGTPTTMDFTFVPQTGGRSGRARGDAFVPSNATETMLVAGRNITNNGNFPASLTLTEIPYDTYNVYVYFNSAFDDKLLEIGLNGENYYVQSAQTGIVDSYVQGTSTTPGVFTTSNFVVFTGVSGASQVISMVPQPGNNGSMIIMGFQVEAVPEPATGALLAGTLGLLALRRRRA